MRITVRAGLIATLVAAMTPLAIGSPARAARATDVIDADAGTVLPFSGMADMTTDHARDLAYVDGASDNQAGRGKVVVVDGSGTLVDTFAGLTSPSGLALSADGATLYVASVTGDEQAIVSVDVDTGRRHTYPLGDEAYDAIDIALVDGDVWFTRNEQFPGQGPEGLGVLDPASGAVHHPAVLGSTSIAGLASAPVLAHTLFVEAGQGFSRLAVGTDDSSQPVVTVTARRDHSLSGTFEISPDGTQLLVGGGGRSYRTSDFASVDVHRGRELPEIERINQVAIAERADGTIAVAGSNYVDGYLSVYRPDHTVFAEQTEYRDTDGFGETDGSVTIDDEGIAFGASTLFTITAVGRSPDSPAYVMHVSRPDPPADPIGGSTIPLPESGIRGIVADPAHSQAFVNVEDGVLVVDDRGVIRRVVQHLPGISQMTLSGTTLWMSLSGGDSLAALDTRTYAVRKYFVGTDSEPAAVAVAAGDVWFSHRQNEGFEVPEPSTLGALDPASGRVYPRVATGFYAVQLRASPLHPHSIYGVAYELGHGDFDGTPEIRIKVTGGLRPTATVMAASDAGYDPVDAVQTPDALHLVDANDDDIVRYQPRYALDAQTLAHAGSGAYPTAVAVAARSDGFVASAYDTNVTSGFPVLVRQGSFGPVRGKVYREDGQKFTVLDRGLAFASNDLYAVVDEEGSYDPRVVVLPMPARQKLSLTTAQDYYRRGDSVRLVAHVEPRLLNQHPEISIEARPDDGTTRDVEVDQRPDASGNVTVAFPFVRPVTFYAQVRYSAAQAKAIPLHRTTPPR